MGPIRRMLAVTAAALALIVATGGSAEALTAVSTNNANLVNGQGRTIRLLGVNRSGTEYACSEGWGLFDSPHPDVPDGAGMIAPIRAWKANAVRVPLNEACWLGINGVSAQYGGAMYRRAIATYVRRLKRAHLHPILDLHVVSPRSTPAGTDVNGLRPMPDAGHAPDFWRSVGRRFGDDRSVLFDLYNEPNTVGWRCLRDGCRITKDAYDPSFPDYTAVGMQRLVQVIRNQGARNVILVPGINWTGNLSKWLKWRPIDPLHRIVASYHNYEGDLGSCHLQCWRQTIAPIARRFPVVTGEFGDTDCNHDYTDSYMGWADRHGVSYLGWTWDATDGGSWTCDGGPSLIIDYDGTPTGFGIGLRDHLLALAAG